MIVFILSTWQNNAYSATNDAIPSHIEADQFIYNQNENVIKANGNVMLAQAENTLVADMIIYDIADDTAFANGNVEFYDGDGNVHQAESLRLNNTMQQGLVNSLHTTLSDGSRLWAVSAIRETPELHVLKDARYTPCKPCIKNPDNDPVWALRASQVTHDKGDAEIRYDDVRFEALGFPVIYIPYFSHPDGTVEQKSGFLTPEIGFGSDYGFNVMTPYYWVIDPSTDVTAGLRVFSDALPQLNLEMRKRYEDAFVRTAGSLTYSERTDSVNGIDVLQDEEYRGHFEFESLWNVNDLWRVGSDIKLTSDEQYLNQYDFDSDSDVLTNRIFAERFEDRDYASVELLAFQDLRLDQNVDQPNAVPYANMTLYGAPNSLAGGRLKWDSSFLNLFRDGNEQDVNRISTDLAWQRQNILPAGLTSTIDLSVRGDAYYTSDRDIARTNPAEDNSKFDSRFIPTAHIEVAYPLHKRLKASHIRVKPRVAITARPDVDNDSDIPNEDSIDAQIDVTNLFEIDRFPGLDRVEDRTRVTYAVETGYYGDNGDEVSIILGQSYRLENDDNPFANGSGFEQQESDIVGQISAGINDHKHNLNYRFQLDGRQFNAERHELFGATGSRSTRVSAIYLYEKGSEGTEFTESREQITASVRQRFNPNWSVAASALYDIGEDDGLRKASAGLSYEDDCFGVTTEIQRELLREASGSEDTSIMVRFWLKNLGEFETTAYDFASDNDEIE